MSGFRSPAAVLLCVLLLSAIYLYAFPQPNLLYAGVVLLHAGLGVAAALLLLLRIWRNFRSWSAMERTSWLLAFAGALLGLLLLYTGTSRPQWNWLYAHIIVSTIAMALLLALWSGESGWLVRRKLLRYGV